MVLRVVDWIRRAAAEAVTPPPPGWESLTQYGALGILVLALGWFGWRAYQREVARADRLEAEVSRLHTVIQDRALPAVLAATQAVQECTELLRHHRATTSTSPAHGSDWGRHR